MGNPLHTSPRKIPASAWLIVAVALGLNFWLDYYHPIGWFLDIIFLGALVIKLYRSENDHKSRKQILEPEGPKENGARSKNQ